MTTLRLIDGTPHAHLPGFTARDLVELAVWMQQASAQGYGRILIEAGKPGGRPEQAGYVLFYAPDSDWAIWGMVRENGAVSVWQCASGIDAGRFATMSAALDSLPGLVTRPTIPSPECEASAHPSARLRLVHPEFGGDFRRIP